MTNTEPPAAIEKNNTSSNNVNETPISIMIMPSAGYSFGYLVQSSSSSPYFLETLIQSIT
jgi:hypothetical protein